MKHSTDESRKGSAQDARPINHSEKGKTRKFLFSSLLAQMLVGIGL